MSPRCGLGSRGRGFKSAVPTQVRGLLDYFRSFLVALRRRSGPAQFPHQSSAAASDEVVQVVVPGRKCHHCYRGYGSSCCISWMMTLPLIGPTVLGWTV